MFKYFICSVILLVAASSPHARDIQLKYNFFDGWKFSAVDSQWTSVGFSGDSLRQWVSGNPESVSRMRAFANEKKMAVGCGVIGACCIGYGLAMSSHFNEKDLRRNLFIAGGVAWGLGLAIELMANNELKSAVRIYNSEAKNITIVPSYWPAATGNGALQVKILMRF